MRPGGGLRHGRLFPRSVFRASSFVFPQTSETSPTLDSEKLRRVNPLAPCKAGELEAGGRPQGGGGFLLRLVRLSTDVSRRPLLLFLQAEAHRGSRRGLH